ncbi:unnamed protein product [Vitrella brassicaformis CCMP3155]|uniref:Uncharacterized protein n=2 Tax=Vitrella brassicaformis TaxID=1169539 RepID=A0A0G4EE14_VITBC|nr:unnamed protein product [Vitrella brassicaformis CCMP3155]|mmetsp:Transcript_22117/g.54396  ORF Transcript_22117/g.54396 Transcript_22117/m.54396 type:complete len:469 (+) Transcript_22117:26-1432(+)|eukprot:CEL93989.1 unnamed protein product [Vitrella brassicaformis CCMP3155]
MEEHVPSSGGPPPFAVPAGGHHHLAAYTVSSPQPQQAPASQPVTPSRVPVHLDPLQSSSPISAAPERPSLSRVRREVHQRRYKTAIQMCEQALQSGGAGSQLAPTEVIAWHTVRIYCLLKRQEYQQADEALARLGSFEAPKWRYEQHPDLYPGQSGSFVPFVLRQLSAVAPYLANRPQVTLDRLTELQTLCVQHHTDHTDSEKARQLWLDREIAVICLIAEVHCHPALQNFPEAIRVLQRALELRPRDRGTLSMLGRVSLQLGAVESAEDYFGLDECLAEKDSALVRANNGHHALASQDYATGVKEFEESKQLAEATLQQHINAARAVLPGGPEPADQAKIARASQACATAANNLAVAHFYDKNLPRAKEVLENSLWAQPDVMGLTNNGVIAPAVKNLLSFWEFDRDKSHTTSALQELISSTCNEDVQVWESLKTQQGQGGQPGAAGRVAMGSPPRQAVGIPVVGQAL